MGNGVHGVGTYRSVVSVFSPRRNPPSSPVPSSHSRVLSPMTLPCVSAEDLALPDTLQPSLIVSVFHGRKAAGNQELHLSCPLLGLLP